MLEHLGQPLALRGSLAPGQHPLGGLDNDGDHAAGLAVLGDDRRVEQVEPGLLGRAAAIEDQLAVLELQRAARHAHGHDLAVEVRRLGPRLQHGHAEDSRMAVAGERAVGIVVEHDAGRPPQQDQRNRGVQHQPQRDLEAWRPVRDGAKRCRPVLVADEAGRLALSREEGQLYGLASVAHRIPRRLPRTSPPRREKTKCGRHGFLLDTTSSSSPLLASLRSCGASEGRIERIAQATRSWSSA